MTPTIAVRASVTQAHPVKVEASDYLPLMAIFGQKNCALDLKTRESQRKVLSPSSFQIDRYSRELYRTLSAPTRFTFPWKMHSQTKQTFLA